MTTFLKAEIRRDDKFLKIKIPTSAAKGAAEMGHPADYGFDLEVVVSQTFSEAAGPRETVPCGVANVRV